MLFIRITGGSTNKCNWTTGLVEFDSSGHIFKCETTRQGRYFKLPSCIGWDFVRLTEWESQSCHRSVSADGKNWYSGLYLRISDNVLDETFWTTARVEFDSSGHIFKQELVYQGAYSFDSKIGWSFAELAEWQQYNSTGQHPEMYYEVSTDGLNWEAFLTEEDLIRLEANG